MSKHRLLLSGLVLAVIEIAPVHAEPVAQADFEPSANEEGISGDAILVMGERLRGQLNVEQAPIIELNEADIEAIGATSVAELLEAIAPQTGSSRGRGGGEPVFLVNGVRIGSFREMRSYPPEAIAKVEVLPEEVAQRIGFPPDRRVVNLILKDRYASREIEAEITMPDRGGYSKSEGEFTLVRIDKGARLNLNVEVNDTSMLTEAERGIIQTPGSVPDGISDEEYARYRSLVADSFEVESSINWARATIESGSSLSFNLTGNHSETRQMSGLRDVTSLDPLDLRGETDKISSSASFGRRLGGFQLTITSDNVWSDSTTRIDRNAAPGFDTAKSETLTTSNKGTLEGRLFVLPAGEASITFDAGFDWKRIESSDTRSASEAAFTRRRVDGGASIVIPIAEAGGAWGAVGDVSLNMSAGIEDLSDFGVLHDWSAGITWGPAGNLTLAATRIVAEAAPGLSELGNPTIESFNVPVFDFVRGETVLATVTTGGNPDLVAETQRDWKFSANWELPFWKDTRLSVDYVRNRSSDVTGSFPTITAETEAAFPDRITRDAAGQLVAVDRRPVTYAATRANRIVLGLNTRGSFGAAPPDAGSRGRGGDLRMPGRPGSDGRGRYFVNVTHTIELDSTILIAPGGPLFDLLDGDATTTFGLPRHSSTVEAGLFRNGKGIRLSSTYTGKTRIDGSGLPGSTDLYFGSLLKVDLRFFADLGQIFKQQQGLLKNFRFTIRADNLFDAHRHVTDSNGDVPLSYQPGLIDPNGRYLGLELRKMF